MKVSLSDPISSLRLYQDDLEVVNQLSEVECRDKSVIIRTLVHEAVCARLGIDSVRLPIIGKIGVAGIYTGHTQIDPKTLIEERQSGRGEE